MRNRMNCNDEKNANLRSELSSELLSRNCSLLRSFEGEETMVSCRMRTAAKESRRGSRRIRVMLRRIGLLGKLHQTTPSWTLPVASVCAQTVAGTKITSRRRGVKSRPGSFVVMDDNKGCEVQSLGRYFGLKTPLKRWQAVKNALPYIFRME